MASFGHSSEGYSDILILDEKLKDSVQSDMDSVVDLAQNIAECCSNDEALGKEAEKLLSEYIVMENDIKNYIEALNYVKTLDNSADGLEPEDLCARLDEKLAELSQSKNVNPKEHARYTEMEAWLNTGSLEEQLNTLRTALIGDSGDEEVAMTQEQVNTKCPYTGQVMKDPVKNTICGHVYDRKGIMDHIRSRKHRAKCPVGGCGNSSPVITQHLEDHKEMKKYIELMSKVKH